VITVQDVADLLQKTAAQVSKYENGHNLCAFAELTAMLVYFGATDEQRREIGSYWQDAKQDSRKIQGSSAVPPKFRAFLRSEADASIERTLQPTAMPGLLQTGDYAAAVHHASRRIVDPTVDAAKATAARLARQQLLSGPEPLVLHALIDEGVIRRVVGSPSVMVNQLEHLLVAGQEDNVTIQVVHEDAGAYGTMSGPMIILGFDTPPDSIYLEYQGGGEWIDDKETIDKFSAMFNDTTAQALSTAESEALIRARIAELKGRNYAEKGMAHE
jgi:hypothetical protein